METKGRNEDEVESGRRQREGGLGETRRKRIVGARRK